jgi:hypothetical protein
MNGLGNGTHLCQSALHAVASDDDAALLVAAPALEEHSRQATLHHARAGYDHARRVLGLVHDLKVGDVLEDEEVVDAGLLAYLLVHGFQVRLVRGHALLAHRGRVVDGDLVELRVQRPELVQDEQQLLRTTQREHRDQALAGPHHNVPDRVREPLLPFLARLVQVHAVRGILASIR